ncbi:MAG: PIN domain-containing protein [Acidobacteria bacterium]|nr:PIN domain-containing protein [Acidobacteriota bacterium]
MIAPDVNVLLYAFREESERHAEYHAWLQDALNGTESVALFEPVLSAVMRIATHPAVFRPPSPRDIVEAFIDACLAAPAAIAMRAESGHWPIFRELCARVDCRGNLIQDAYLAAIAVEHNCTYITTDRDYARFPRLRCRHPLD